MLAAGVAKRFLGEPTPQPLDAEVVREPLTWFHRTDAPGPQTEPLQTKPLVSCMVAFRCLSPSLIRARLMPENGRAMPAAKLRRLLLALVTLSAAISLATARHASGAPSAATVTPSVAWAHITSCFRNAGGRNIQNHGGWLGGADFPPGGGFTLVWQFVVRAGSVVETEAEAIDYSPGLPGEAHVVDSVKGCLKPYNPKPDPGQTAIFIG